MESKKKIYTYIGAAIVIGLLLLIVFKVAGSASAKKKAANVSEGRKYLKELEKKDTDEIDKIKEERRKAKIKAEVEAKKEELKKQMENVEKNTAPAVDGKDVWSNFENYALLGDSRGVGFSYYKCLAEDRVFAGTGWTLKNINDQIPSLKALSPSSIFLCFGINDTLNLQSADAYTEKMRGVIETLQAELPNATIYVNSILPATNTAIAKKPKLKDIPAFNEATKALCKEMGVPYVDNDEIAAQHPDLYEGDGIHFKKTFYDYWGANMINVYYDVQADLYDFGTATDAEKTEGE